MPSSSHTRLTRKQELGRATGKLIRTIQHDARMRLDEKLKGTELTSSQVRLLDRVRVHPGSTGAQLARMLFITPQSVQSMLARAVAQRWVSRGIDPENGRLVTYRLSVAGGRALAQADAVVHALEAEVWAGISAAEMTAMNRVLERCLANLAR